jgi:hypothetical protein
MKLTFVGSPSKQGDCPTIYKTDRGTYVVQGLRVTDIEARAQLHDVLDGEDIVEVPAELFRYAPHVD